MSSRLPLTGAVLSPWLDLLRRWAQDGQLEQAARGALRLEGEQPLLAALLQDWAGGRFSRLPSVHVLDQGLPAEALGAYGEGAILLQASWLQGASGAQLEAVLTEELGHHLDALLNNSDTAGDEGELFAHLLLDPAALDASTLARLQVENDQRLVPAPQALLTALAPGSVDTETPAVLLELAANTAPTAVRLSTSTLNEGEAPGAVVGSLSSVDADTADTFTYTLVSGSGSDDNGTFSINQYNQLVTRTSLDREQKTSYRVRIRSTDAGGLSAEQAFVINLNNLQDPISLRALGSEFLNTLGASSTFDLSTYFDDPFSTGQVARFTLSPGLQATIANSFGGSLPELRTKTGIDVLLFDQSGAGAPLSAANLAQYVNAGRYRDTIFHRLVPGFVLQGGGFVWSDSSTGGPSAITSFAALQNEFSTARGNIRGTVAMAKLGGDPNSATSQWFFNLGDNTANLDNQNGGFTVIGRAKSPLDLLLMDILSVSDTPLASNATYQGNVFQNLPVVGLTSTSTTITPANALRFSTITLEKQAELSYSILSNSRPDALVATVSGSSLQLKRVQGTGGTPSSTPATVVVRATNLLGETVDQALQVTLPALASDQPNAQPIVTPNAVQGQPGSTVRLPLHLNSNTLAANANQLQLAVHFNSTKLSFSGYTNILGGQVGQAQELAEDTANSDGDPSTDRMVLVSWSSGSVPFSNLDLLTGQPLQQPLPQGQGTVPLGQLSFRTELGFSDSLVRFRSSAGGSGSPFTASAPATITTNPVPWNLDLDGDGRFDPRIDGSLLLQYGLGTFPAGLGSTSTSPLASRTAAADIQSYLQSGISSKALDVDGNGLYEPLVDGLLAIHHGIDPLSSAAVLSQPLGAGATRTMASVLGDYLTTLMP